MFARCSWLAAVVVFGAGWVAVAVGVGGEAGAAKVCEQCVLALSDASVADRMRTPRLAMRVRAGKRRLAAWMRRRFSVVDRFGSRASSLLLSFSAYVTRLVSCSIALSSPEAMPGRVLARSSAPKVPSSSRSKS